MRACQPLTDSLASPESAVRCATAHWSRHRSNLPGSDIPAVGVRVTRGDPRQVPGLVSFGPGIAAAEADDACIGNHTFRDAVAGWPRGDIGGMQATSLVPFPGSPLQ